MPMPNRKLTDGNYRYAFQGQEKDPETGKEAFERRLYDNRIGKWLKPDDIRRLNESPYTAMGNEPINSIDPDGRDVITLVSLKSVSWAGHGGVLIGNDNDGWRYVSKNGTNENNGFSGPSHNPNLGDVKFANGIGDDFRGTGLTANQVITIINKKYREDSGLPVFDRAGRFKSNPLGDHFAYNAAVKQAESDYHLFTASCLNVNKDAVQAIKDYYGRSNIYVEQCIVPRFWSGSSDLFNNLFPSNGYSTFDIKPTPHFEVGPVEVIPFEDYDN
jgi:RHS repeat-associated protein